MANICRMLLTDWLARERMTKSRFAERLGVSAPAITDLCSGKRWLSRRMALAIWRETGGHVSADDFLHIGSEGGEPSQGDAV